MVCGLFRSHSPRHRLDDPEKRDEYVNAESEASAKIVEFSSRLEKLELLINSTILHCMLFVTSVHLLIYLV